MPCVSAVDSPKINARALSQSLTCNVTNQIGLPLARSIAEFALERARRRVDALVANHLADPLSLVAADGALARRHVGIRFELLQEAERPREGGQRALATHFDLLRVVGQLDRVLLAEVALMRRCARRRNFGLFGNETIERVVCVGVHSAPLLLTIARLQVGR